jgi:hypothetical protein
LQSPQVGTQKGNHLQTHVPRKVQLLETFETKISNFCKVIST